jgi:hypothetical protein
MSRKLASSSAKKTDAVPPGAEKSLEALYESLCDPDDPEVISMVTILIILYLLI